MMSEPIRILQVVTHMNRGGLETMLMNYYRHIDRRCVQFDFLVHRSECAAYDDEIEALGGKIFRLPRLVPWSRSYRGALDRFFRTHPEYRIVHVHQDCFSAVILQAAEKCGVPVRIAHSHSSSQDKNFKYPIKLLYKRLIPKYATALFACGQKAGRWMFGGEQFQILNNAIDVASFQYNPQTASAIRRSLGIPEDCVVFGHVGRFSPPKNHAFLVDVFAELTKRSDRYRLLLVGDGALRHKIEKKIRKLGLADKVVFTGIRTDTNALLSAMDVFVFPSLYEGLGIAAIEAQAAGLPCFVSDGVAEDCLLTDLVQVVPLRESPGIWAERLCSVKKILRSDVGDEIIRAGFDIVQNAKLLEEYYIMQQKANE